MVDLNLELPENYLDEEVRDGYTISHEMKKIWAVELDLLNEVIRVCNKYNIKWFAVGGTLLGAIRHKGMIPWDDDIDIAMFREDYQKFISVADKEFQHPYFLQTDQNSKGVCRCHLQLRNSLTTGMLTWEKSANRGFNQGIFLDIFPIDAASDNADELQTQIDNAKYYKEKIYRHTYLKSFQTRKNIFKLIGYRLSDIYYKIFSIEKKIARYDKLREKSAQAYNHLDTQRVVYLSLPPITEKRIWKREWFNETIQLPFEMLTIPAPANYDELLTKFYGNWREFVVGKTTHGGIFFDTEKPYTDYINSDSNKATQQL